jgi:hypothetical protein
VGVAALTIGLAVGIPVANANASSSADQNSGTQAWGQARDLEVAAVDATFVDSIWIFGSRMDFFAKKSHDHFVLFWVFE